jgi:hypothetical protein
MKDFYDIWTLASEFAFNGRTLGDAIVATFARRQTPLPSEPPVDLTDEFSNDETKRRQWEGFLNKGVLEDSRVPLSIVLSLISDFLMPLAYVR